MLFDLAVLETEDVHDGTAAGAGLADGANPQHDEIAIDMDLRNLAARLRKLGLQDFDKLAKPVRAILRVRVVLDVGAEIFRRRLEILAIEALLIEVEHDRLVALLLRRI